MCQAWTWLATKVSIEAIVTRERRPIRTRASSFRLHMRQIVVRSTPSVKGQEILPTGGH